MLAIGAIFAFLFAMPPFEAVAAKDGPAPEVVTALLQDKEGFIWIGSRQGLLRYDGFSFKTFRHDPNDARSLPDNAVRVLLEDRDGAIWAGTNTGGLARLDRRTWTFDRFRHDSADPRSLSHDSVYALAEDADGLLWIGTQHGLNRLHRGTLKLERANAGLQDDYVASLALDPGGNLYVGTGRGGLHVLERASGSVLRVFRHDPRDPRSLPADAVYALAPGKSGALWVGTQRGLVRLDTAGTFERIGLGPGPVVTSLAATDDAIWAGTDGQGLWRVDPATGTVRVLRQSNLRRPPPTVGLRESRARTADPDSDQVTAVLADRAGSVWTGTWGGGLFRISPAAAVLAASAKALAPPPGVVEESATAVTAAHGGGAFIGTNRGALVRVAAERSTRLLVRLPSDVLSIAESSKGQLWVGTTGALWQVDPVSGAAKAYRHEAGDPASIGPGWVAALREHAGALWAGTGEGGLQRLDSEGRVVQRFRHSDADPASLSDDYVTAIVPDRRGTLWIGTRSGGLNAFDPATGRFVRFGRAEGLAHHSVTSILEDSRGRLWVATAGGGFARLQPREGSAGRFASFTTADGLVDDDVMAMVEDAAGTLWIGTRQGISRFDPGTRAFAAYLASDGLASAQFERGAGARAGGLILLGSVRWIVPIRDDLPFVAPTPSATAITSVRRASGERPGTGSLPVELRHGEWLSVELAVLDFASQGGHAYAYRLGQNTPWVELGSKREITFAGLAAGTYHLQARGRDVRGAWSSAPPLAIRVIPPFWGTAWFRVLLAVTVLSAGFAAHRIRESGLERRNRELVANARERERSRSELAAAYERLGLLTRRLEAAKEDERAHIARELHDELGPNLTAVIINLKLLGDLPEPQGARKRVADSTEIVDRMIQRIRDISLDLRPPLLEEMGLATALRGYLEAQADRTGLAIAMDGGSDLPPISSEVAITAFRVTQEAVTNAVRHAAASAVRVALRSNASGLEISVDDDGNGFDVRATIGQSASKALGLLGMQERVRLLGGEVRIVSEPGAGTRIHVQLPFEVGS